MPEENKKTQLFREKNVEAMESPEQMNDYLQVTSVRLWLILGTVIVLVAGTIVWGIFGRIRTTAPVAIVAEADGAKCYMPYENAEKILAQGRVILEGKEYAIVKDGETEWVILEKEDRALLNTMGLQDGDLTVTVPVTCNPEPGIYAAEAVTEDLHPISLLLQ